MFYAIRKMLHLALHVIEALANATSETACTWKTHVHPDKTEEE